MAVVWVDPPLYTATINAANDYSLRPAQGGTVSRWVIELTSSSFVGSITVKARGGGSANAAQAVPYVGLALNGAAGSTTPVTTAITGTSLIEVDSAEMDVVISCTAFTSGSMQMIARPAIG
jgi:hypothetical protein